MNTEISDLFVIGINYKISTFEEWENYQINRKEIRSALNYIKLMDNVEGIVIISTFNMLEFFLEVKPGTNPFLIINDFFCWHGKIAVPKRNLFYLYNGIEAAVHLFKVAAGLNPMLIGDYQALDQLKNAYSIACSEKTAGKILHKLFHYAFRVSKQIKAKTRIGSGNKSLSGAAFKIIAEKFKKEDLITIIGVNQNTKIIAEKLNRAGFSHLLFVNRTLHKAEELADKYKGVAFSLDFIEESLISSKCIFSCTGAPGYIINSELINNIYLKNKLPKLIIDMALPRDIDTKKLIKDIEVINLEGLMKNLEAEKEEIILDLPEAERIILSEAQIFEALDEGEENDGLSYFHEKIEAVRLQLLDEIRFQIPDDQNILFDKFSRSLTHRMKSIITGQLKQLQSGMELNKGIQ